MIISAKSPCRVDLAGSTLDIWPLYLYHDNPVTVNFAVDRYTTCVIETRADAEIHLRSEDLVADEFYPSLADLQAAKTYRLPLAAHVVKFFAPEMGLSIHTHSEAPAGAGISGSSALLIAACSAMNKLLATGYPLEKIREIAQNIESRVIRVPTGSQDYYPAMYGGVSAIELGPAGIKRVALSVDPDDLTERTVLAYTGEPRNSGINNWEVTKAHINGDKTVHRNFDQIAAIANLMRAALENNDWTEVARLLREEWSYRRKNAPGISTPLIDQLVLATRRAGAVGAKVCGAGGGGCVLFLVERGVKAKVAAAIEREGASVLDVQVARQGVKITTQKMAEAALAR